MVAFTRPASLVAMVGILALASGWIPSLHSDEIDSPAHNSSNIEALRRTAVVEAIHGASPSIVNIQGRKTVRNEDALTDNQFKQVNGMGTGVVIDPRGYIVTNYHVVDGVARIQVTLNDRRVLLGRLVAHDRRSDLAIIHVNSSEPLPVINVGRSHDLLIGESVIAIGNAFGYEHTVTRGIISAKHRTVQVSDDQKYHDLIQTDASINPGNSGGPLINVLGEMVGINVAVRVGAQGIGFAIPVDEAMEIAARLITADQQRALYHGISGKTVIDGDSLQYIITSVDSKSPAATAGLAPGDQITAVEGSRVDRALDFQRQLIGPRSGDQVNLSVRRGSEIHPLQLVLSQRETIGATRADDLWSVLGLKLASMPSNDFRRLRSRYRGGLRVVAVRSNSPAAEQGVRRGDVLVGMHEWETKSLDNVAYIINHDDFSKFQPLKFYILRGHETLYGFFKVNNMPVRVGRRQ